jgi:membrane protein DedA with SNARE-associated domain
MNWEREKNYKTVYSVRVMNIITGILTSVAIFCISIISSVGYFGLFLLMTMESMILPVPSEMVMPFAGFLISGGKMEFVLVVLFSTLGSLLGSLISYSIGIYGGNRFVKKYGKYFLLNEEHLVKTEEWFSKKGELTIFIGRFVPIVRHVISIPAGIGKMNLKKFMLYTVLGAGIWNAFLAYIGYVLGNNWTSIKEYADYISWGVLVIIVIVGMYFLWKEIKKRKIRRRKIRNTNL